MTSIGSEAFFGSNLESVVIPNSVTVIGDEVFEKCQIVYWNVVTCDEAHPFKFGVRRIIFGDGVKRIPSGLCRDLKVLHSVTIPNSVTEIGNSAFSGCENLTSVTIPNSVTEIGDWAFSYCYNLTSLTIPSSVKWIGKEAFSKCYKLSSVTLPAEFADDVEIERIFYGCEHLRIIRNNQ